MKRAIWIGCLTGLMLLGSQTFADEVENIEVTGQAAIVDGDKAAARDKALDDALRKAVESAVGTMISSETITENYQLISDKIYSQAEGYVQKYKILDEKAEEGVYIVEVKADVVKGAVAKDLDGLKTLFKRKNMPKAILMIAEQNVDMSNPVYWWGSVGPVSSTMKIFETRLMELMQAKGFTFVDTEVLTGKKTIRTPVSRLSDKQALRIAKTTDADIIIVGQAVATNPPGGTEAFKQSFGRNWTPANAEAQVRVINCDNGKIIASATSDGAGNAHLNPKIAGSNALKIAAQQVADKLIANITKVWSDEVSGANEIRMTVTGYKNRKQLTAFINVLSNRVRGVKAVREKRMQRGQAILEVDLAGDTRHMATELEAKDFGGDFSIEINSVTNNSVEVKLIP